jgi:gluconate 2-dehydrogenase gamma chain
MTKPRRDADAGARQTPAAAESTEPVHQISRRDALKSIATAVPAVGALAWYTPEVARAAEAVAALPVSEPGESALQDPKFFTAHEWRTVRMLVDYVIPRDDRSGSATDAKVPEFMDFMLSDPDFSDAAKHAMRGGLAWLDAESRRRSGRTFVAATDAQRRALLDDIAYPRRARPELSHGVAFFNRFRDMTASGFFSSAMGWRDLQYMGHVFVPTWAGCPEPVLNKLGVRYS